MRPSEPRLAPLPPEAWSDEQKEILAPMSAGKGLGRGVINVFATMVRHPKLFKRWAVFASHVMFKSTLDARTREILILRIAHLCRSDYEWGQHVSLGRDAGLSMEEIERIRQGADAPGWAQEDIDLLRAVDELHGDSCLSDETWSRLARRYSEEEMLDVIFTVGNYNLLAMALNSCGVPLDKDYETY